MRCLFRSVAYLALVFYALASAAQDGAQFTSFAGFNLGRATLAQVSAKLGPAKLWETGEAGNYEAKICYRVPGGTVYFLSNELGGAAHYLLGFGISDSNSPQLCAELRGSEPPSLVLGELRLGVSKADFSRIVGRKVIWEGNVGRSSFESHRSMTLAERASMSNGGHEVALAGKLPASVDVVVSVIGRFANGRLTEVHVWKAETF